MGTKGDLFLIGRGGVCSTSGSVSTEERHAHMHCQGVHHGSRVSPFRLSAEMLFVFLKLPPSRLTYKTMGFLLRAGGSSSLGASP